MAKSQLINRARNAASPAGAMPQPGIPMTSAPFAGAGVQSFPGAAPTNPAGIRPNLGMKGKVRTMTPPVPTPGLPRNPRSRF